MKKYVANVKDSEGRVFTLTEEYPTKKAFKSDIAANGLKIINSYIFTEEEYEKFINEDSEFMAWFIERLEKRRIRSSASNVIRKFRRECAKRDMEILQASNNVEEICEDAEERAVEENKGVQILKQSIAKRKANGGDATKLEELLIAVSNMLRERFKEERDAKQKSEREIEENQNLFKENLDRCKERASDWLPSGYRLQYFSKLGIVNNENNTWLRNIPKNLNKYEKIKFEKAFEWVKEFNKVYKEYQKYLRVLKIKGMS